MHMSALFIFPVLIFFGLITLLSAVKILLSTAEQKQATGAE